MASKLQIKRSNIEGKVPLITDLDLGELAINTFDGKVYLKRNDGSESIVDLTAAKSVDIEVRNQTGSTVPAGTVIYLSGSSGSKALIGLAQANTSATSTGTYGIVKQSISNNSSGFAAIVGQVQKLDTSQYTPGQILWLSPTIPGGYTTVKPAAPNYAVYVGIVTRSHQTQGTIEVRIRSVYELEELHDVTINNPLNEEVLSYDSQSNTWKNKPVTAIIPPSGDIIAEMRHTITTNYSIKVGNNGFSIGPVVIADGAAVTVPPGSRWIIHNFQ